MSISKEQFRQMLKEKGLKVTNQRLLVLEVLAENCDRHMTAEDIYEMVKEDYPRDRTGHHLPDSAVVAGNAIGGSDQSG